jgi:hypothetical protein
VKVRTYEREKRIRGRKLKIRKREEKRRRRTVEEKGGETTKKENLFENA